MFDSRNEKRSQLLAALLGLAGALASGCSAGSEAEEAIAQTSEALTIAQRQFNMNVFYDMNNAPQIDVTMAAADWTALKAELPIGPDGLPLSVDNRCAASSTPPSIDRYKTYTATNVSVSGTSFATVEIKKKSYCGSFDTTKPSFKLKLPASAEDSVLGTRYLVLNNSIQDASFVRQCLAFKLFGMAGLSHSRCNFAKVNVKTTTGTVLDSGVWVNVEPIRERYIDNPDNHFTNVALTSNKLPGNLYEFEADDFTASRVPLIDVENISKFSDKADLVFANQQIASGSLSVIDMDNFIKLFAMEILLKHWDGYTTNRNNTYIYDDVVAVPTPTTPAQVRFKFIPWGVDQVLQPGAYFKISDVSLVGNLVHHDSALALQLSQQIQAYRLGIFSRATIAGELKTFIDLMETKLAALGVNATAEIAIVRKQLTLVRSAGYIFGGFTNTTGPYVLAKDTGDAMHASNSEVFGAGSGGSDFEIVHQAPADSAADRWWFGQGSTGYVVTNEAYGRYLHASGTIKTPANHLSVYQTLNITSTSPVWHTSFETDGSSSGVTGYFTMQSERTGQFLRFGTDDPTPSGRQRVYQTSISNATPLYWN